MQYMYKWSSVYMLVFVYSDRFHTIALSIHTAFGSFSDSLYMHCHWVPWHWLCWYLLTGILMCTTPHVWDMVHFCPNVILHASAFNSEGSFTALAGLKYKYWLQQAMSQIIFLHGCWIGGVWLAIQVWLCLCWYRVLSWEFCWSIWATLLSGVIHCLSSADPSQAT